ncbi:hypothetical protein D3C76_1816290 [compost metagenome]
MLVDQLIRLIAFEDVGYECSDALFRDLIAFLTGSEQGLGHDLVEQGLVADCLVSNVRGDGLGILAGHGDAPFSVLH